MNRRTFVGRIAGAGAVGLLGSVAGCVSSGTREDDDGDRNFTSLDTSIDSTVTTQRIKLGGKIPGWQGIYPPRIQDLVNPALTLVPSVKYDLTWINLDGAKHNLLITNASGKVLAATEATSNKGATRTVTFTATAQMTDYQCEYHPQSMLGNIRIVNDVIEQTTTVANETTESNSPTPTTADSSGY